MCKSYVAYLQAKVLGAAAMAGYEPAVSFVCSPYTHSLATRDITRDPDLRGMVYQLAVAQPEGCKPAAGQSANSTNALDTLQTHFAAP